MKHFLGFLLIVVFTYLFGGFVMYWQHRDKILAANPTPSQILRFPPVCKGSDPNDVRIAQAELCRHGIDVEIDGDCGKQTAMGQCKLWVMIQNGYKVRTIYEKRN